MADKNAKIGIYICTGCDIGDAVDMDKVVETVEEECSPAVCKVHGCLCSEDGVNAIKADITSEGINRVIVGACSGRYLTDVFNFGDDLLVERVPLREYVAWTQPPKEEDTQMCAEDYLRMAVARMEHAEPPTAEPVDISKRILVVGGGVTGLTAARAAAEAGYEVVLVEKEAELGGRVRGFSAVFPKRPPYRELETPGIEGMVNAVRNLDRVKLYTASTVQQIAGQPGEFDVTIANGSGEAKERIGAVVLASGWNPYPAERLGHLGHGSCRNVVTNMDMEAMVKEGKIVRPSDGAAPGSVAFIQCAGSRDEERLPYCSAVCCRVSLKQARYVRERMPDAKVYILYKDVRSPMQFELFYAAVQEDEGIFLTKGEVEKVEEQGDGSVTVTLTDTLLGEKIEVTADLVVLASGMTPTTLVEEGEEDEAGEASGEEEGKEGAKAKGGDEKSEGASAEKGAGILNLNYRLGTDLPTLKYGFPDSHFICFPYETRRTGIYAAGTVRAPMDIDACIHDAYGATMKAIQCLEITSRGMAVHPRTLDCSIPDFNLLKCTQCKRCTEECPFGSLDEDEKGTPQPNPLRCRRCGVCMGACPERIVSFKDYSVNIIAKMIKSIHVPDEEEEKPRIIVFCCENDALPALHMAALHRKKISPYVRFIPLRCLGSMNIVWIADALSSGFDGALLMGCRHGDDYQCHFIRGSELAETRMENVQEKLDQLALERERVKILEVAIDDYEKVPEIINSFADEIEEIGLNPFKGF